MPVKEIGKKANARCQHQRAFVGCLLHARGRKPTSCVLFSCGWLADPEAQEFGLHRPDRGHYVVDPSPDYVVLGDDWSTGQKVPAIQVWVDPKHRDAHRDPALRAYLARHGERGAVTIIRYSSSDAFTLIPPAFAEDGQWREHQSVLMKRTPEQERALVPGAVGK